jgi:hypothetical protein
MVCFLIKLYKTLIITIIALSMIRFSNSQPILNNFSLKFFIENFPSTLPNGIFEIFTFYKDYMKISNLGRKEIS